MRVLLGLDRLDRRGELDRPGELDQPEGREEVTDDALRGLYAAPRTPWLRVNMVSTLDGSATGEQGTSGGINNPADKRVFDTLRGLADAIVVGAGTARTEGYGPVDTPIVLVSRSAEVPPRLQDAPPGSVWMASVATSEGLGRARDLLGEEHVLVTGTDEVDLRGLKDQLARRGMVDLLSEGGPHLLRDLVAQGAADEVTCTIVPRLVAGDGPRIAVGPPVDAAARLALLLEDDGTLLGRWWLGEGAASPGVA